MIIILSFILITLQWNYYVASRIERLDCSNVQPHSCKVIQILESRKLLAVETEILGFGIQNSAQEIRKISLTNYWDPLFQIP